jgi:hypothetical protein
MATLRDKQVSKSDSVSQAIRELQVASAAAKTLDRRATIASCRRAAGLAWKPENQPHREDEATSLMDIVKALAVDASLPPKVCDAARVLIAADRQTTLVSIQRRAGAQLRDCVEAAKTIVAEAWYQKK